MARTSTAGLSRSNMITAANAPPTPPTRGGGRPLSIDAPTRPVTRVKAAQPQAPVAGRTAPTHDQLARRAYEVYLERAKRGQPGTPQSDWAQAEADLTRP